MTLQEIQAFYQYFNTTADEVGLVLYVILDEDGQTVIRQADIDQESRLDLKTMFLESLGRIVLDPDLEYMPISQGDARKNTIYSYDLAQIPAGLEVMGEVLRNQQHDIFNFGADEFSAIKGFVITIGNDGHKIALYKAHSQLNLLRGATVFGMRYTNERFERVREDIIKLSSKIDFFQIGGFMVVVNLAALERGFNFENIIRHRAMENIAIIEALALLEDTAPLTELIAELKHAKKVMRIKADSPVMQIPVPDILLFVQTHPPIMRKFRLTANGDRLKLDTKVSKELFLKLINDDLLTSNLTKSYYESLAKDSMNMEVQNEPVA